MGIDAAAEADLAPYFYWLGVPLPRIRPSNMAEVQSLTALDDISGAFPTELKPSARKHDRCSGRIARHNIKARRTSGLTTVVARSVTTNLDET